MLATVGALALMVLGFIWAVVKVLLYTVGVLLGIAFFFFALWCTGHILTEGFKNL